MRFPVSWPPIITVGEELRDIPAVNALTVVRRIDERTRPSVFRVGFSRDRRTMQQTGAYIAEAQPDKEIASDRRKMCRRIYHLPVMLDTRSGTDRRHQARRDDEVATHIAIEA